ncbi:MAG: SDR family oxidoreductase [Bauldia sp.]|nr:SDR family oxidoreductase [Bauldia sp.]
MIDLTDRIIVLTGAAGILGRRYVSALAELGARVIALDLAAALAADATLAAQPNVHAYPVDLSDVGDITAVSRMIVETHGAPHGLVNNAASKGRDIGAFMLSGTEITPETWREVSAVNLDASFFLTREIGRSMVSAGRGSILFIGSIYGEMAPDPRIYEGSFYLGSQIGTPPVYSATKAAVGGLTRYLAALWGEHGVRVNCVSPGGVSSGQGGPFAEKYAARVPLRRMATPDDMVGPVAFLLSDAAAYITGQTLLVDGGLSIW